MPNIVIAIVVIVMIAAAIVVTALITQSVSVQRYKEQEEAKLGDAEEKAR